MKSCREMREEMSLEVSALFAPVGAVWARKRPLARMFGHVPLKKGEIGKCFVAHRANKSANNRSSCRASVLERSIMPRDHR